MASCAGRELMGSRTLRRRWPTFALWGASSSIRARESARPPASPTSAARVAKGLIVQMAQPYESLQPTLAHRVIVELVARGIWMGCTAAAAFRQPLSQSSMAACS
eukprot:SM000446S16117  [mRNA]  locus=s446:13813:14569:+ [translate_table: standard]